MSSRREVLYQLLITLFLLATLEAVARLAFTLYVGSRTREEWFIPTSDAGWDRRPNFSGLDECGSRRTFDSQGYISIGTPRLQSGVSKPRRVVFLGDSNTYGLCLTTETTFVEVAARLLPKFDLINLGVPGYTSYQGYKQLLKYGDLIKPDTIFISFNFNDRRYVTEDNDIDSDVTFKNMMTRAWTHQVLEYSYLFRFVRALVRKGRITKTPVDKLKPRVDPQNYRTNLIRMVEWARQHKSTPYFILMGDNPSETALLRQGIDHFKRQHYEAAINDFTLIIGRSRSNFGPLARLYLSPAYRKIGQTDQAEQALLIEPLHSNHGGAPILLDSDYNKIMRDVAQEYDVPIVDAKSKLDERPRVFFDSVHFDAEGHEIVGKLLMDVLAKPE